MTQSRCLGFDGVCEAGERVEVVENDRRARQLAGERAHRLKTEAIARRGTRKLTLDEVFAKAQEGVIKELNIVLKADVSGSLEALRDELAKVPQEQVRINIIRAAAGGINESDVMLAAASDAIIIGFNVRPLADARRAAESEGVEIRTYSVIYKVTEELRAAMEGMLDSVEVEEILGQAEIKETFRASKVGMIAGCEVTDGKVTRDGDVRLIRDGTVAWTGKIGSLRRFQDNVQEVEEGQECGIVLAGLRRREGRRHPRGVQDQAGRADPRRVAPPAELPSICWLPMATDRMRRVNGVIREVLGDSISTELEDPRIGFVTVTAVETSPDLRSARVFVSVLGDEDEKDSSLAALRSAHGVLQSAIAQSDAHEAHAHAHLPLRRHAGAERAGPEASRRMSASPDPGERLDSKRLRARSASGTVFS